MAHWCQIDEKNMVVNVTVGNNDDPNGDEGYQWLIDNIGGRWIKTSYNTRQGVHLLGGTPLRGNYGYPGCTYDEELDAFIPPKPYDDWVLDPSIFDWAPPPEEPPIEE